MRDALTKEKQLFRYRLCVIRDFALSHLKELRYMATLLYNKLQDWINYTVQVYFTLLVVVIFLHFPCSLMC